MCKHIVVRALFMSYLVQRFQTTKVTFKLTQGNWQSCHSIGHILLYHCNYVSILYRFRDIIAYFQKCENVT